ncbi:hypothetical protein CLV78_105137 [Aliiruegeria haliotis]|uniref:Cytochrome c domain-containing protein n=1 Tax=Aliiruegeria haliotis TaxID=1280846 RepID=A0A2T0RPG8_9RHOB|nr:hypothetical protein [Aliiruegeria haliotis]PRY23085.1 hypothetical protein CLV78_105137 [Aliiruegeria haliotis]
MRRSASYLLISVALLLAAMAPLSAQDKRLHIAAPATLVETGFLRHLLPRFSLKYGIPITVVAPGESADAAFTDTPDGTPAFASGDTTWHLTIPAASTANPHLAKFADWLGSDIGRNTVTGFAGPPAFSADFARIVETAAPILDGDQERGAELSLVHCGRCHVIGEINRMNGVGSTPSFAVMRTFKDWKRRFSEFYALKPHPSFTQVTNVTEPFADGKAPHISPVEITLEEIEDIVAFAASVAPADLGAPIQHQ